MSHATHYMCNQTPIKIINYPITCLSVKHPSYKAIHKIFDKVIIITLEKKDCFYPNHCNHFNSTEHIVEIEIPTKY